MFEIPADISPAAAPLAWLIGRWQGWGVFTQVDGLNQPVLHDFTVHAEADLVLIETACYRANGNFDPMWTAEQGLDNLRPGELFAEEVETWRVTNPYSSVGGPAGEPQQYELEVETCAADSHTAYLNGEPVDWSGICLGPRIQLQAVAGGSPTHMPISRMFGLVDGELMFAYDVQGINGPYTQLTGRLQRVSTGSAIDTGEASKGPDLRSHIQVVDGGAGTGDGVDEQ